MRPLIAALPIALVRRGHVRKFDAYGALDYLRGRSDVIADRIGLQGWSNGGMTDPNPGVDALGAVAGLSLAF